tara:strand:+ start:234 stop:524 length:291 start_codon:yes stop_codon:yes gene_type:complete
MSTPNPVPHLPPFHMMQYTDKDGNLTQYATLYNDIMNQILRQVAEFFNDGVQMPIKTNAEIAAYAADTAVPVGTMWFSSTDSRLKVKTAAGTIQTL